MDLHARRYDKHKTNFKGITLGLTLVLGLNIGPEGLDKGQNQAKTLMSIPELILSLGWSHMYFIQSRQSFCDYKLQGCLKADPWIDIRVDVYPSVSGEVGLEYIIIH